MILIVTSLKVSTASLSQAKFNSIIYQQAKGTSSFPKWTN